MILYDLLETLTKEYLTSSRPITCETSIGLVTPKLTLKLLELNERLKYQNAEWVLRPCVVCLEHNFEKPLHLEIDKLRTPYVS